MIAIRIVLITVFWKRAFTIDLAGLTAGLSSVDAAFKSLLFSLFDILKVHRDLSGNGRRFRHRDRSAVCPSVFCPIEDGSLNHCWQFSANGDDPIFQIQTRFVLKLVTSKRVSFDRPAIRKAHRLAEPIEEL